jgi:RNA polymerase I-specific transcription initiation factor RRN6
MSQRAEVLNAHSTKYLNYGHLGTITYDEEERTWKTLRVLKPGIGPSNAEGSGEDQGNSAFPLHHLSSNVVCGGFKIPQEPNELGQHDSELENSQGSSPKPPGLRGSSSRQATTFRSRNHQFTPVTVATIPDHAGSSAQGLALGNAITVTKKGGRSSVHIPIAACLSGRTAQCIRLVRLGVEAIQAPQTNDEGVFCDIPRICDEDEAYWSSNGVPIQQVCFAAQDGYASTWMAARLRSSTTVFHPLFHRDPVEPRSESVRGVTQPLHSSLLDPHPVITIPISRTGGHVHADVAFHSRDHTRLALIDEHGNWSVWHLSGRGEETFHSRFWINLIGSGKLWTWDFEKSLRSSPPYHDRWHKISWLRGSESASDEVLVCNRRTIGRFKTSGEMVGVIDLRLGHAREGQWILDLQPSSLRAGDYFVLTSTRLFWLSFSQRTLPFKEPGKDVSPVLLSWQHFRNREDRTLHLVLLETSSCKLPRFYFGRHHF